MKIWYPKITGFMLATSLLFLVFDAQALTIEQIQNQPAVLGQQNYQTTSLYKSSSLTLSVTPFDFDAVSGTWNYKISWKRQTGKTGSIYINGNLFYDDAYGDWSNYTGYSLAPLPALRLLIIPP